MTLKIARIQPSETPLREPHGKVVQVGKVTIGGSAIVVMAGPCSVESREQIFTIARAVHSAGARILRGGVFKPRTSPYCFRGLREEGLKLLSEVRREIGLPVVTEVMDVRHLDLVCAHADMVQIGCRSMQNFTLLEEVGRLRVPVLLKRGMGATIQELLLAAEYIAKGGNKEILLCERGIRTFETMTRNTLDLNAVPILKRQSPYPVIVDPSHGTGRWWMVLLVPTGVIDLMPFQVREGIPSGLDKLEVNFLHDDVGRGCSLGFEAVEDSRIKRPYLGGKVATGPQIRPAGHVDLGAIIARDSDQVALWMGRSAAGGLE
jgi:3-deoxy-7-phosphoheptulonate synthase